jgi:hypothetical protein
MSSPDFAHRAPNFDPLTAPIAEVHAWMRDSQAPQETIPDRPDPGIEVAAALGAFTGHESGSNRPPRHAARSSARLVGHRPRRAGTATLERNAEGPSIVEVEPTLNWPLAADFPPPASQPATTLRVEDGPAPAASHEAPGPLQGAQRSPEVMSHRQTGPIGQIALAIRKLNATLNRNR